MSYNGSDFCLIDGTNCALGGGANSSISGSGSANQIAFWSGPASIVGNANFSLQGTILRILTTVNASRLLVGGVDVCLANGTNCIAVANGTNGVDGINGSQGPPGVDGLNGTNGINGTSVVNVTYLANGSMNVTLSNGVSFISPNLTGPQGAQGTQGIQGETGATGSQGPAGQAGTNGTNGINGTNGANGTGVANATVLANGSLQIGLTNGTIWIFGNVTGQKGDAGAQGAQGVAGTNGTAGQNGSNGTGITAIYLLANGSLQINLTSGVNTTSGNLTGQRGDQGVQGVQGIQGIPGIGGTNGTNGTNGLNGTGIRDVYLLPNGSLQINLTNGTNITTANITGATGPQGATGATGQAGSNGTNGSFINGTDATIRKLNVTKDFSVWRNGTSLADLYVTNISNDSWAGAASYTLFGLSNQFLTNPEWDGTGFSDQGVFIYVNGTIVTDSIDIYNRLGYRDIVFSPQGATSAGLVINSEGGTDGLFSVRNSADDNDLFGVSPADNEVYVRSLRVCLEDGTNCPPGGSGNSSWNESYARGIFITNGSSARLITLNVTNVNVSGITATNRLLVGSQSTGDPSEVYVESTNARMRFNDTDGLTMQFRSQSNVFSIQQVGGSSKFAFAFNSTSEKVGILTTAPTSELTVAGDTNVSGVIYGGSATLGGLTTTSDATIQGVLVVDPGTATAAAVRVGGPLTTYSALQFQSEQNRTRDFIFSSVNNSVASNRMAFRVSGNEAGANSGGDLSILRFDDSGAFIDTIMKIDRSDGYVGIGDTTPDAKLDVLGDTVLEGDLNVTGTIRKGGVDISPKRNYTIANQVRTSNVPTPILNLSMPVAANEYSNFECRIPFMANTSTSGLALSLNITASTNNYWYDIVIPTSATALIRGSYVNQNNIEVVGTAVAANMANHTAYIRGSINTSGAGSIIPRYRSEINGNNVTIWKGADCEKKVIA